MTKKQAQPKQKSERQQLTEAYQALLAARKEVEKARLELHNAETVLADARNTFEGVTDDIKYTDSDDSFYGEDDYDDDFIEF
jgi:hypothetical protein